VLDNQIIFEATRSFAYRFVRYTVLPEVAKEVSGLGDEPFLLREIAWPIIDRLLTPEQQAIRIPKAQSAGDDSLSSIVRFYVSFLAKALDYFKPMGNGYFRAHVPEDITEADLVDEAIESGDAEASEFDGWIYAFSFPTIVKPGAAFPIKVGKTVGSVESRVLEQVKGSASFEQPVILGSWQVKRVGPTELAIHNVLKARSKWRETAPGREWFDKTLAEIESIIAFVRGA
jgi:T5orf172 domain